jgi:phenylacetate-CoA ligase
MNKGYLSKFQIIQEDFNKIKIKAVKRKEMPTTEKKMIEDHIKIQMGKNCQIHWDFVNDIQPSKSGKYFYTKSLINH